MTDRKIVRTLVMGIPVKIRKRTSKRWAHPRYEVFLNNGEFCSGKLWRSRSKWASTEGRTFSSRRAGIKSLIELCLHRQKQYKCSVPKRIARVVPSPSNFAICSICRVSIRRGRLASHVRRVHSAFPDSHAESVVEPLVRPAQALTLVRCTRCSALVKPSRLDRHLRRVHSKTKLAIPKARLKVVVYSSRHIATSGTLPAYRDKRGRPRFLQGGLPETSRRWH